MNLTFLIIAAVLLCCFFAAYLWFAVINRRLNDISFGSPFFGNVFFPVWLVAFAGCTALYFLLPEQNDQLFDISFLNVAAAFISAAAVCLLSLNARIARWNYALFLAAAILNTLLLPQGFMLFEGTLPFWLDRLTIALIWSLFAWAYKYLDGLEGIVVVQTVTPLCGMVILAFLGAIPILTGCFSAVFALIITAYAVYNWYPAQLRLTTSGCQALGFLTAWLFMLAAREGSASCALIFSLYYIVEVIWAGLKKRSQHILLPDQPFRSVAGHHQRKHFQVGCPAGHFRMLSDLCAEQLLSRHSRRNSHVLVFKPPPQLAGSGTQSR